MIEVIDLTATHSQLLAAESARRARIAEDEARIKRGVDEYHARLAKERERLARRREWLARTKWGVALAIAFVLGWAFAWMAP